MVYPVLLKIYCVGFSVRGYGVIFRQYGVYVISHFLKQPVKYIGDNQQIFLPVCYLGVKICGNILHPYCKGRYAAGGAATCKKQAQA